MTKINYSLTKLTLFNLDVKLMIKKQATHLEILRSQSMENTNQLTIEQQFKLQLFRQQAQNLSQEQAQEFLVELFRQMMVKDNVFKNLIKND